jgi:thiol-disulfide isomerase/thioredoxin
MKIIVIFLFLILIGFLYFKKSNETLTNSDTTIKIYNFNTEWCGYSKMFQPIWDEFAQKCDKLGVKAIDIKCDSSKYKQMCEDYNIRGYPTVILQHESKKIEFEGERTVNGLINFVKSN